MAGHWLRANTYIQVTDYRRVVKNAWEEYITVPNLYYRPHKINYQEAVSGSYISAVLAAQRVTRVIYLV
jgi:hypothetical protein